MDIFEQCHIILDKMKSRSLRCPICLEAVSSKLSKIRHYNHVHKRRHCDCDCAESFATRGERRSHCAQVHGKRRRNSAERKRLNEELKQHHPTSSLQSAGKLKNAGILASRETNIRELDILETEINELRKLRKQFMNNETSLFEDTKWFDQI